MIRLNVSQEKLETGDLLDTVKDIIWYQIFWKDALGKNIKLMKLQKDLYESKDKTTVKKSYKTGKGEAYFNLVKPLCDTAANTFLGRVPDIVSTKGERESERISKFTLIQKHNDFEEEIADVELQASITGSGFLSLYADKGDVFPHYRSLDPLYTNVVYDCSIAMKRLFAYHIYYDASFNGGAYVCIIYTKSKMFAYYTPNISITTKEIFVYPYQLFLIDGAELSFTAEHGFNDIPIFEFMNNKLCMGDCQPALSVIDLYGKLQNNRFQNVDDIINYLLVIKNARLGDDKETQAALDLIQNNRMLPLEGQDSDAKFLSNPLNQTDIKTLATEYKALIHQITRIPDMSSKEFTENASEPVLKTRTQPLLELCMDKEKWFNRGYIPMLETTLDFVYRNDKTLYEKIKFKVDDIDLVYSHTLPSNDNEMVNNIVNLGNQGVLDPRVALQGLSFIPNVDDYLKGCKEWNEYVDKRKETIKNNNIKANTTNLERQNSEPQTSDKFDNKKNAIKGISQDISENKVE